MKINILSDSLGARIPPLFKLAFVLGLITAAAITMIPIVAVAQNPVNFISGSLFSGVGYGDRYPGAANVYTLATGDFNKDGKMDVITTNGDGNFGVMLGNGDGTFQAPLGVIGISGLGAAPPAGIVVGDFDKNGTLDFATVWNVNSLMQLAIYLGDGASHFSLNATYQIGTGTGHAPRQIAAGDLNGDGVLDLIVPDAENWAVAVLYGKGNGTFQNAVEFLAAVPGQTAPVAVAIGDLNRDGSIDIVAASATGCCPLGGGITVLLNKGSGTFQAPMLYADPAGVDSGELAIADLNADGKLDVVESSFGGNNVAIFLGNGDGTFQTAKNFGVPQASGAAIGDLNGDKKPDIAVSSAYNATVWVLLNKGSGNFQVSGTYSADSAPMAIALADFNGDKKLDFVAGNNNGQFVTIALGSGDGTFQSSPHYNVSGGITTQDLAVADFNLDGSLDIVQGGGGTGVGLSLMLGASNGLLKAATFIDLNTYGNGTVTFVRALDINADGKADIVCGNSVGVVVLTGLGTGKFKAPVTYRSSPTSYPVVGWLADLNGDGKLDIVTSNNDGTLSVLLNKGSGTFGTATVFSSGTGAYPSGFVLGDFNGDSKVDIVVGDFQGSNLELLAGKGNGTFQSPVALSSPVRPNTLAAADFNKDSKLDLAVASNDNSGSLAVLLGNGNGTFSTGNIYDWFDDSTCIIYGACDHYPISMVAVDFNGDANLDLAIAPRNPWYQSCGGYRCREEYLGPVLFLGKGDGTFVEQIGWLAGVSPWWIASGDFNNDGMPDLAFVNTDTNYGSRSVTILQNATQALSFSPGSVLFAGTRNVGTSISQTVILTNDQTTKLTVSSIGIIGPNAGDFSSKNNCGTTVWAGLHCTITVTFKPLGPLTRTASLRIIDNLGTQNVALSGIATELKLSAATLAFGSVTVGQTKSLPVIVTNFGTSAMNILSPGIVVTGTAASDYSQSNTCGTGLAAGGTCTITVVFKPTKIGSRSAVLNINDNGGPSPQKVTLSGKGI